MDEAAKNIKLPEGLIERSLGGCLALCMGLALAGAVIAITGFTPFGVPERVVKIAAAEFLSMLCLYCLLVVIWCICTPRWVQITVNKVMENFLQLVLIMSVGVLLFLGMSLALA